MTQHEQKGLDSLFWHTRAQDHRFTLFVFQVSFEVSPACGELGVQAFCVRGQYSIKGFKRNVVECGEPTPCVPLGGIAALCGLC